MLFVVVVALRLYLAFQTPYFSSDAAYFHVRQIEHIRSTGMPLFQDALSYGGRTFLFSPVFHYLVAGSSLVMPLEIALKVVPNLLAASIVLLVYALALRLTKKKESALLAAALGGFVPMYFAQTFNQPTPITLVVPALFLLLYALLQVKRKKWLYTYLAGLVVLSFTHPLILVLCLGLLCYLVLARVERLEQGRAELELALFSVFFVVWAQFVIYKKLLLVHGPLVIWQNIPREVLSQHFADFSVVTAMYHIGLVSFVFGIFAIYRYLFREKNKELYLIISFAAAAGVVLWLRLIELNLGLMFFGLILTILFAQAYQYLQLFLQKTKVARLRKAVFGVVLIAVLFSSVVPSVSLAQDALTKTVSEDEAAAFEWLRYTVHDDEAIVTAPSQGHTITALTHKKNVIDDAYLLRTDAKQRFTDVRRIFKTQLEIEAIDLMDAYGAAYILMTATAQKIYGVEEPAYVQESRCFEKAYDKGSVRIYKKLRFCKVKVVA